ncbi:MAG TPA: type II toxin-antitoxin system VapC family toxin [Candidatus Cybelea sp.]|jgi:PIN domain nuclease of toxin-antitoxin system|nr:type II toxin-antitoxin system VapC family toxin [Candidatus Cybelea sp.]
MILDTCSLLWLASGDKKLSRSALKQINEAPAVYVSAISGFEIAIKVARGKLKLPSPPHEWFERILEHHGIAVLPLELNVCMAAAQLPPIHDEPCDRFIIAAAKASDLAVVTTDERFEQYGLTVLS